MQREEVQEKIAEILDGMRKVQHPQVAVKTLLVALQEVPAETYFNEDALTRVIGTREIAACPRLVCQNRQRANISGLRALSYPAGVNLSGKDAETSIATCVSGDILEVCPTLARDKVRLIWSCASAARETRKSQKEQSPRPHRLRC